MSQFVSTALWICASELRGVQLHPAIDLLKSRNNMRNWLELPLLISVAHIVTRSVGNDVNGLA